MNLSDLLSKLSSRIGYTIDSYSKPTQSEAESFIHEGVKKVVNLLPPEKIEALVTSSAVNLSVGSPNVTGVVPSLYGRFISMVDLDQGRDVDLLPPTMAAQVMGGYDSILLPDYCAVRLGNTFYFRGVAASDEVNLVYQKQYETTDLPNIEDSIETAVLLYATYLSKLQDEELQDSQLYIQEFIQELQLLGAKVEVRNNES